MKAIITAGGKGTRMRPLTFSSNKHLIPIANKPLLFYAIETVIDAGIKEIGINYNPGQLEELQTVLGNGKKFNAKFTFILQDKPLGLANIVQVSEKFIGKDKFVMHLGDNIFYGGIKKLVAYFDQSVSSGLLTILHHPENSRMGVPYFDKKGNLKKLVEKPEKPPNDWGIHGLYFADKNIFKCFSGKDKIKPSTRGEYEIPAAFQWLIDHNYQVETKEFTGIWRDPGKFDDWLDTNRFLLDHELTENKYSIDNTVKIEGRVKIGKRCHIKNSTIRGPVIIGDNVRIENSFIGPYCSINDECVISNAQLENTILLKNVQIIRPNKAIDNSLIGESSKVEGNNHLRDMLELFVGNQCSLKV